MFSTSIILSRLLLLLLLLLLLSLLAESEKALCNKCRDQKSQKI